MKPALHIIDTHQHLWDPRTQRLAWLAGAPPLLSQTYGPAEYQQATSGHRVQAVYMEVDVVPEDRIAEMQKIVEIIGTVNSLTFAAVVSGPVGESGFQDYLDSLIAHPQVRGLRRVLHNDEIGRGYCLQPTFIEDVRELGRRGLSFDICIRPRELDDALTLVEACPETLFILDHCGNADPKAFVDNADAWHDADAWCKSIEQLGRCKNVICKISGIVARLPADWPLTRLAPIVDHCLDSFPADRVVFGSDWPVCRLRCELADWVEALQAIVARRPQALQDALWSGNARRVYRL